MDIVKCCCCCCCFGPKSDHDDFDVAEELQHHPEKEILSPPPPPPPPPMDTNMQEVVIPVATPTLIQKQQPVENEIDMNITTGVAPVQQHEPNEESEVDVTVVVPSSQQQPTSFENEVDMTSSTVTGSVNENEKRNNHNNINAVVDEVVTVRAPAEASAGSTIPVEWSYNSIIELSKDSTTTDMIAIYPHESTVRSNFAYTRNGSPETLVLPTKPGLYTIAYVSGNTHC